LKAEDRSNPDYVVNMGDLNNRKLTEAISNKRGVTADRIFTVSSQVQLNQNLILTVSVFFSRNGL